MGFEAYIFSEFGMSYALYSNGKLLHGTDPDQALRAVLRVYRIPEQQAREMFLSGRRHRLTTSNDQRKLQSLCAYLRGSGLDVEVIPVVDVVAREGRSTPLASDDSPASPAMDQLRGATPSHVDIRMRTTSHYGHRFFAAVIFLLTLMGGSATYAWYWLYVTVPAPLLQAEEALADGSMLAIGFVDAEKLLFLGEYVLGGADPGALPLGSERQEIFKRLFSGPAHFDKNLQQVMIALHSDPDGKRPSVSAVLAGNFDVDAVVRELGASFDVVSSGGGAWELRGKSTSGATTPMVRCEKEPDKATATAKAGPMLLRASSRWLLVSSTQQALDNLWSRLEPGVRARQNLARWRNYRGGQLAAFLVHAPEAAAHAIDGLPGMMISSAAKKATAVNGVAAAAAVDIPARALRFNTTLFSDSAEWRNATVEKARQTLSTWKADGGSMSPALAALVSRVSWREGIDYVGMDVAMNKTMLSEIEQIVRDLLFSLFTPSGTISDGSATKEAVQERPADYSLYAGLSALPGRISSEKWQFPLFVDGAYAVDLESVRHRADDGLELSVAARVQMPEGRPFAAARIESIGMRVNAVQGRDGGNLIRDETCASPKELLGTKNHEPEKSFSMSNDQARITKKIRLRSGVDFEDVTRIDGEVTVAVPVVVRKFDVSMRPGEIIEHQGLRLYISSIRGDTVTYQLSGNAENLLEIRALNKSGQALRESWSINSRGGGRASQSYKGEIHGLEVYVAEQWLREEKHFVLQDLTSLLAEQPSKERHYFAPDHIDTREWQRYANLDFRTMVTNPEGRRIVVGGNIPIAELSWPALKMAVSVATPPNSSAIAELYFPALKDFPAVLSALGYRIEEPTAEGAPRDKFVQVSYPYYSESGELAIKRQIGGLPVAEQSIWLRSGWGSSAALERLKGEITIRLPTKTISTHFDLNDLWNGSESGGIKVTLTEISRGMFPGYALKIEGSIDKLVNVHGVTSEGRRIAGSPVNFQSDGYWTMTLPFNRGIQSVELISATEQKVFRFPFDINATTGAAN